MGLKKAEYGEEGCWSLGKRCEHWLMVRVMVVVRLMVRMLMLALMFTLNKGRVAPGTCSLRLMYSVVHLEHGLRSQKKILSHPKVRVELS